MRRIVSACLAGFVIGLLQSMYFLTSFDFIELITSPFILLSTVTGFGSGLAATETDNTVVNILVGILAGVLVYSFLGYYTGEYLVAAVFGLISGAVTGFAANVV